MENHDNRVKSGSGPKSQGLLGNRSEHARMRKILINLAFILVVSGIGAAIGLMNAPGEWFASLDKPFFNPPGWLFGPVWTVLYVMIAIAGARTALAAPRSAAMRLWIVQMALNFLWSPAFFGLRSPAAGLMVILPLLASIIAFIISSRKSDRIAALFFWPYLAWVGFATVLNASIWALN